MSVWHVCRQLRKRPIGFEAFGKDIFFMGLHGQPHEWVYKSIVQTERGRNDQGQFGPSMYKVSPEIFKLSIALNSTATALIPFKVLAWYVQSVWKWCSSARAFGRFAFSQQGSHHIPGRSCPTFDKGSRQYTFISVVDNKFLFFYLLTFSALQASKITSRNPLKNYRMPLPPSLMPKKLLKPLTLMITSGSEFLFLKLKCNERSSRVFYFPGIIMTRKWVNCLLQMTTIRWSRLQTLAKVLTAPAVACHLQVCR